MNIREQIEKIMNSYDPECDRHPDGVHVNVTDMRMLEMIENLAYRLARLEIFTGMIGPEPLPETKPAAWLDDYETVTGLLDGDAPTEAHAETAHFINGEVDYASGGDGQALESIY